MSSTHNGTVILKSFADLSKHIDVESLPPGPSNTDEPRPIVEIEATNDEGGQEAPVSISVPSQPLPPPELASVIAQLASLSNSLELAAREDARAREQATIELARYQTLAAERGEAERALAEAREVRSAAEVLANQAFTEEARAQAARNAAVARAAELACTELLAERTRASDELASRPHLARVIADQRRREQEQVEAARRAEEERSARLAHGLTAARAELEAGNLDEARRLLAPLTRDFPTDDKVQSVLDTVRWQAQQLVVAPAEAALRDARRALRESGPERAMGRLADVQMLGLPDDLARQVFGVWSNACYQFVKQQGWLEPLRYSIITSRGAVLAKPTLEAPHQVLSALGMGRDWFVGKVVTDAAVLHAAWPLRPPKAAS
jgi:hypothetical protein